MRAFAAFSSKGAEALPSTVIVSPVSTATFQNSSGVTSGFT